MSHRRKHVLQSVADECPTIAPGQRLLRVCGPRGSNILEVRTPGAPCEAPLWTRVADSSCAAPPLASCQVEDEHGAQLLVRMPQRFNKMLWVKRGARRRSGRAAPRACNATCKRSLRRAPCCVAGSFLIAEVSDAEAAAGDRVRGEVVAVVYDAHLRQLRKTEQWCVRATPACCAGAAEAAQAAAATRAASTSTQAQPARCKQARWLRQSGRRGGGCRRRRRGGRRGLRRRGARAGGRA